MKESRASGHVLVLCTYFNHAVSYTEQQLVVCVYLSHVRLPTNANEPLAEILRMMKV